MVTMSGAFALPDVLASGLRVVFCGTAAGDKSAAVGKYYAGPGNSFWPTLHSVGLTPQRLAPSDFLTLPRFGIGLTDIAKYRSGNDTKLADCDFDVAEFRRKLMRYRPKAVAFNGKSAAAVFYGCGTGDLSYGLQTDLIGESAVWVLPSTSGGARGFWDVRWWRDLAASLSAL
jgi:double-stranded uracil-DNA glycosylase